MTTDAPRTPIPPDRCWLCKAAFDEDFVEGNPDGSSYYMLLMAAMRRIEPGVQDFKDETYLAACREIMSPLHKTEKHDERPSWMINP